MKYFSFLIIFLFSLMSRPSLAAPTLLVTPLPIKKSDAAQTWELINHLEAYLGQRGFKPMVAGRSVLGGAPSGESFRLTEAIKKAEDLQFNFQNGEAIETILSALGTLEGKKPTLEELQKLADAHLLLAFCYKNEGSSSLMSQALDEAARMNPSLIPSEMLFPPSLIAYFEAAKDRIWNHGKFTRIMVTSQPMGAEVYINGAYKGTTPLRIDQYPEGKHHFFLKQGGKQAYKKVTLQGIETPTLNLKLGSGINSSSRKKKEKLFSADDVKKQEKWLKNLLIEENQLSVIGLAVLPKGKKKEIIFHPVGLPDVAWATLKANAGENMTALSAKITSIVRKQK